MIIRTKKTWKDLIEKKSHEGVSRRDFIKRGLLTTTAAVGLPSAVMGGLIKGAFASQASCPSTSVRSSGAFAQIFRDGGPSVGAMFIHQTQAAFMNSTIASNYGITQTDLAQAGSNWYLAKTSPFGMGLLTPPAGYTQARWNAVLMKTSLGGHYGPFSSDDGAGQNLGMLGSVAPYRNTTLGKDLRINNSDALAAWALGSPSTGLTFGPSGIAPSNVAANFALNPSTYINSQTLTNAAKTAESLSQLFMGTLIGNRTGGQTALSSAVCGFYGDSVMADPTFGPSLFDPTKVSALSGFTLSSFSSEEQALLASFYQSAIGSIGGVVIQQGGNDYHNTDITSGVAPVDYEAGRIVAMFLAACDAAQTRGALISLHNGQCISAGVQSAQITGTGNTSITVSSPNPQGDAGGAYNAGFILCYDPSSPPSLSISGTFDSSSGNVVASSNVTNVPQSVAGLYLTAMKYLGFNTAAAQQAMTNNGISVSSGIMLI